MRVAWFDVQSETADRTIALSVQTPAMDDFNVHWKSCYFESYDHSASKKLFVNLCRREILTSSLLSSTFGDRTYRGSLYLPVFSLLFSLLPTTSASIGAPFALGDSFKH